MKPQSKIAALIINWNGAYDTLELIHSLCVCMSERLLITPIIIDNASSESDLEILEKGLADLKKQINLEFRSNKINIGVPAAYNQAIQIAGLDYDHYLRLDNDVILDSQGLIAMIDVLDHKSSNNISIVGGNIKYFDRKTENNCGAVTVDLIKGKTFVSYPLQDIECDGVLGCIMLLSGNLVRRYFPEIFENMLFICTDETELSLRAKSDGMYTFYLSRLIGFHKSGRSTSKVSFLANYYSARNWTLHRLRYVSGSWQIILIFLRFPLDILRCLVRGRWASLLGLIAGLGLAVTWFLDQHVKRGVR